MMIVKAISLQQPWASLIATGQKTIETRKWGTSYRGKLLIVSSKKSPNVTDTKTYPGGVALALVDLVDCKPMTEADQIRAGCAVYPKAVSWFLENIRPLKKPVPIAGQLGLFDVEIKNKDLNDDNLVIVKAATKPKQQQQQQQKQSSSSSSSASATKAKTTSKAKKKTTGSNESKSSSTNNTNTKKRSAPAIISLDSSSSSSDDDDDVIITAPPSTSATTTKRRRVGDQYSSRC